MHTTLFSREDLKHRNEFYYVIYFNVFTTGAVLKIIEISGVMTSKIYICRINALSLCIFKSQEVTTDQFSAVEMTLRITLLSFMTRFQFLVFITLLLLLAFSAGEKMPCWLTES